MKAYTWSEFKFTKFRYLIWVLIAEHLVFTYNLHLNKYKINKIWKIIRHRVNVRICCGAFMDNKDP